MVSSGKKGTSVVIPPLQKQDHTFAFTDLEKADELNTYFASISTVDDTNIELPNFNTRSDIDFTNIQVRESEVINILKILKVNKATGPDGISNRMLKSTCNTVCAPLTRLFNLSLRDHQYPGLWKVAHVMPLFKKGDKSLTSNHRPVSLTSKVGKSFERLVFKHLYNHINENNLLYKYQSGFLPGHSTVHHLIELMHNVCISLEQYETNCQIFCDISKAFDRVWHRGLLHKLEKYGIKGDLLFWLTSYLNSRKQEVFVNGVLSSEQGTNAGNPQGSVLGPLLFLIYINDIADELIDKVHLYADDTSLSYSSSNLADIEMILNNDLKKLNEWAEKWLIISSPEPLGSQGELKVYPWSRCSSVRPLASVGVGIVVHNAQKIFSETAGPIKAEFYVEPPSVGGTIFCSRHLGHMTKMAAMPIYGKNP